MSAQPGLPLLTPGSVIECHGPELLTLCAELDRLGLCALAMDMKGPARYRVTIGERMATPPPVMKATAHLPPTGYR